MMTPEEHSNAIETAWREEENMKLRYEIRDNNNPTRRGSRFMALERAQRELAQCVGRAGRWSLVDRQTKQVIATR